MVLPAMAQTTNEDRLYYNAFADVLLCANDLVDGADKAYYYAIEDLDNDGVKEFVIADIHMTKTVFKAINGKVQIISPEYTIDNEKLNWHRVEDFYTNSEVDRSNDITLRHHPMFAYDINIVKN